MIKYGSYIINDEKGHGSQIKTTCPRCPEVGKKNIKDTCLSIDKVNKVFNCHKCGFAGYYGGEDKGIVDDYKKPNTGNLTLLKDVHLSKLTGRGITQETIVRNNIKSAKGDWWAFPYYEGEEIVNIKYKSIDKETGKKKFMQSGGAKQLVYKYNDIAGQKKIIICEGEEDALSWEEAGILFACSVSQGAPNEKDKNIDKKLACIYNCFDEFENAETIYLAGDNDDNGQRMNRELIKMFTAEKCKIIDYGDCKDANEYLCIHDKDKLKELYKNAKDVKVEGIFECKDFENEILFSYRNYQPIGTTTYFKNIDENWKHRLGEVTVWTGYNNEGKSLLLKQLLLLKSKYEGWKHAIYSPEEVPLAEFYTDIIESYIGKSADKGQLKWSNYMSEMQIKSGIEFCNSHFYTVYPDEDHSIDELLRKFSYLVRRFNIKTVSFDPYNQIHHKMKLGEREDLYISRFMSKLRKFAVDHMVAVHLVAHQSTPLINSSENYPKPNIYKIKGGGTFGDKADNVVVVWREYRNTDPKNTEVKFISQKIKKQKLTGIPGESIINYDRRSNRYIYLGGSPLEKEIAQEQKEIFTSSINPDEYIEPSSEKDAPF